MSYAGTINKPLSPCTASCGKEEYQTLRLRPPPLGDGGKNANQ
jgi:hypothetical protein